jgi:hypothetical protein
MATDTKEVRARIEQFKAGGLTLCNMMISGFGPRGRRQGG